MINTESVRAFWKSLPTPSPEVREILYLLPQAPDENGVETIKLAFKGYLGCIAFVGAGNDEIVLRLLPKRKLTNSPVAVAWDYVTEGMTIAPDLQHFVAGRLAQMDAANPDNLPDLETQNQLINFAAQFGNPDSTLAVLKALEIAKTIEEERSRRGALWAVADVDDPTCQALAASWSLRGDAINDWVSEAIHNIPNSSIVQRIYVASQLREKENISLIEIAWKLILDNDIFDSTYTGYTPGPATADWENEALVQAVNWLQRQSNLELPTSVPDSLWVAAQTYAEDPLNYDGSAHLAAAKEIATFDPVLAYTHTANAAAFFARTTQDKPTEAIIFAHQLAVDNGWEELQMVLNLAGSNLDFDLDDF
jgi:hypothetical protein